MDFKFSDPHYDCMPREIAGKALWQCSSQQFKLLYFIARKTLGFQKFWDRIPLSQFTKGTKLARKTVIDGLRSLHDDGWIAIRLLCPQCGNAREQKICQHCESREPPHKEYALVMSYEVIQLYNQLWGTGLDL